ncbi:MAG: hypothetical protein KAJ05_05135, partial [Candidatus Latescibacteria bacterium]|nr:hypothetical protein [Candidatus Latescibacterota bacterium]
MIKPYSNDGCNSPPSLSEWLRRYRCNPEAQLSRYEGSHLLDRVTVPLPVEHGKTPEIAFGEAVWQCTTCVDRAPDRD